MKKGLLIGSLLFLGTASVCVGMEEEKQNLEKEKSMTAPKKSRIITPPHPIFGVLRGYLEHPEVVSEQQQKEYQRKISETFANRLKDYDWSDTVIVKLTEQGISQDEYSIEKETYIVAHKKTKIIDQFAI